MSKKKLFPALLKMAALIFLSAQVSFACRIIDPRPIVPPPHIPPAVQKPIETRKHKADITIDGQMVSVHVEAVFHNPNNFQIEGTYFFPLPADVALDRFSLFIGNKEVKGELLDAEKARRVYEDIVRRMKDPALLEFAGMQMIKVRVFPIRANSNVRIRLSYNHVVKKDSGMFELIYPLRSAIPESGLPIGHVVIKVNLHSSSALKNVYSPTHKIDKNFKSDNNIIVGYEAKNILPERNFYLYWSVSENDIALNLLTYNSGEEDGYFIAMVSPGVEITEGEVFSKDILFVLDKSGSMEEDGKIEQAKKALSFCLGKLREKDRFNIITFSTAVTSFRKGMVEATGDNVEEARNFIRKIDAGGGTAMDEALAQGLNMLSEAKNFPMMLFLTDGLPTVGVTDIEEILRGARQRNKKKARLFVFGVGYDVNTKLLDRLAEDGRGVCGYVQPSGSIEVKVSNLYDKISNPVLSDISVIYDRVRVYDTHPKNIPDVFKGSQLLILGRYEGKGEHTVRLKGKIAGRQKEYVYRVTYGEKKAAEFIPALWAMRQVGYLLDQIRLHGSNEELAGEIKKLGKKYGIVTPYTSFLAVEEGKGISPSQARRAKDTLKKAEENSRTRFKTEHRGRVAQEVSSAAGGYKMGALDAMEADGSKFQTILEEGSTGEKMDGITRMKMKHMGQKTFFLKSGAWYDSEYNDKIVVKMIEIKFLGEDYFALIDKYPSIAEFLSVGDNLILCWRDKVYRIVK